MSAVAARAATDDEAPFLGVRRSASGRLWRARAPDDSLAEHHRRRHGLPEIAARLLAARGVGVDAAPGFLAPRLRDFLPDPSTFVDMDRAARAIEDAIVLGRRTAVFADYDVDGGTSAAQLVRYFRHRGRELEIYVPDRMAEGYGPTALAFQRLKAQGMELVITVDCGAAAHGPLEAAHDLGLDVVVIDHHLMSGPPPRALAVVNPNRPDCGSGQGALTAAGVVLVTLAAVNREARRRGSIGSNDLPDLMRYLDLSALGTVCDVAPLTGLNRAIVAQGLKILRTRPQVGVRALADAAGRPELGSVYDLGFVLGPRLNAGGRIGVANLAARLLSTDDPIEAASLAAELDQLNADRRKLEADMLAQATVMAEAQADAPVIVVGDPAWHPGVIGIAAGRLKERFLKPTLVLGGGGPDESGKGSGRSVTGVNLGAAVAAAAKAGVLRAGGGHAMAAGLTIDWDKVDALRIFLQERLASEVAGSEREARTLWIDAVASPGALTLELLDAMDRIGPYGVGHPEPVFALCEVRASFAQVIPNRKEPTKPPEHVRFVLEDAGGRKIRGVAFKACGAPIGDALLAQDKPWLHVAVRLKRNSFNGETKAEVEIVDLVRVDAT